MGDHPLAATARGVGGQTVGQGKQLGHVGRAAGESLPCRFGERPTRPRVVHVVQCRLEMMTSGKVEADRACQGGDARCRSMQVGEQGQHLDALVGRIESTERAGSAVDEREQRDRVARTDPTDGLPALRGHRRDHGNEAAVAERQRGVERPSEALEHRLPRVSELGLPVEVVHRHEATRSIAVAHHPVVAPTSDRRILGRLDLEAPAFGQGSDEGFDLENPREWPSRHEAYGGRRSGEGRRAFVARRPRPQRVRGCSAAASEPWRSDRARGSRPRSGIGHTSRRSCTRAPASTCWRRQTTRGRIRPSCVP